MRISSVISLSAFSATANAAVFHRDVANNNCGRAVAGTARGAAFMSSARADCSANVVSSYSTVYVTPPASTVTTTLTAQATSLSTTTSTSVGTETTTSTISQTQTLSTTYTPVITSTSTLTFTSGSPVTVTLYTPTAANPLAKREIEERVASSIPAYASPCTAYTEYVAACSVAGVYGIATVSSTLPAAIVYVTNSVTSTSLSIVSSTSSTTQTISTSVTNIESITTTITAQTTTTVVTTSVTVQAPTQTNTIPMPNFKIAMTPIKITGPVLYMQKDPGDEQGLPASTDISQATVWTIDVANHLVAADGSQIQEFPASDDYPSSYYIQGMTITNAKQYSSYYTPFTCTVAVDMSLSCAKNGVTVGYAQYTNKLYKWWYTAPGWSDYDQVNYPTYMAKIVPV